MSGRRAMAMAGQCWSVAKVMATTTATGLNALNVSTNTPTPTTLGGARPSNRCRGPPAPRRRNATGRATSPPVAAKPPPWPCRTTTRWTTQSNGATPRAAAAVDAS